MVNSPTFPQPWPLKITTVYRYKGKYTPSYLLCPETFRWKPMAECAPKFAGGQKYARLEEDMSIEGPPSPDVSSVLILKANEALTFDRYVKRLSAEKRETQRNEVGEYSGLVGPSCSKILLYRS